jgi:hypothetical protein
MEGGCVRGSSGSKEGKGDTELQQSHEIFLTQWSINNDNFANGWTGGNSP